MVYDRKFNRFQRQQQDTHRINNGIRAPQVMLVDSKGQNRGIMTADKARWMARNENLDLVEVAPSAKPPVCRIMDYQKFKYEQAIKEKEKKSNAQKSQLKELRLRPVTGDHDLEVKTKNAERWLQEGDKVLLKVKYKKRENEHKDLGLVVIKKIIENLKEIATQQSPPKFAGDTLTCVLEPIKK